MAKNISVAEAAERLESAGLTFGDRYEKGTSGKGSDWLSGAKRGVDNYKTGIARSLQENSYSKGVDRAGANAYDEGIRVKGVNNWGPGMQVAGEKYQRNVAPFAEMWDDTLPTPRGARRSGANLKRMQENVERFVAKAGR